MISTSKAIVRVAALLQIVIPVISITSFINFKGVNGSFDISFEASNFIMKSWKSTGVKSSPTDAIN